MFTAEFKGINSFLVGMAKVLLEEGVERKTRGEKCWELTYPVMIKISNPLLRWVTIPERKWSLSLPYAESLWLALGRNDLELIKYYLPSMKQFSDDRESSRGGYSPRLRCYNGNAVDYKKAWDKSETIFENKEIDQFYYSLLFLLDFTKLLLIVKRLSPSNCAKNRHSKTLIINA